MRGAGTFNESLFTLSHLEGFIPGDHSLRSIRAMVNEALVQMAPLLARMYSADSKGGRPGIASEKLLRAMLLQVFYSVRSGRQLVEQTRYNLLFRCFAVSLVHRSGHGRPRVGAHRQPPRTVNA